MEHNQSSRMILHNDTSYTNWLEDLKGRFLKQRLKAMSVVNNRVLEFYWSVGRDITSKRFANNYGSNFYKNLSDDLKSKLPGVKGFSQINLRYMTAFYALYSPIVERLPQAAELSDHTSNRIVPQLAEQFDKTTLFSIPWDHHRRIIDKCKGNVWKAIFFVQKTIENNWSRNVLLNWLDTDLYEREGRAVTNFRATLPAPQSNLAQEITKDPYSFDFLTLREEYDERDLENALVSNVTNFLLELGKGYSYMGRQLRLAVGQQEFFPDLLFYNTHIHAYIVIELKVKPFKPEFLGQLSFYVSTIDRQLKSEIDNPTIGLLICKDKDNIVAKYALDAYKQPLGISEYELSKLIPKDFKTTLPSIDELEEELKDK
jgi:predicted nuclease of restriction endonuclease-like (RecB) superfamily